MLDHISEKEERCLRVFAKWFEAGDWSIDRGTEERLRAECIEFADGNEYVAMMKTMDHYCALDGNRITPFAVQLVRQLDKAKEEKEDIVEKIQNTFRQNKVLAWIIIAFAVFTAFMSITSNAIQIAQNLGWMAKP